MTPDEAADVARLAGRAAGGIVGLVEGTQRAVTDQAYRAVGALVGDAVRPVRAAHGVATRHTYFWVRTGMRAAGWAAAEITRRATTARRSAPIGPRAQLTLGVVNGLSGDRLVQDRSQLAVPMSLRHEGREVPATRAGLVAAYGAERDRVVVLLPGLVETEQAWGYRARHRWGQAGTTYASRLLDETDWQPVLLRYNTGLAIADNAQSLGVLLGEVVQGWPVPVRDLVLVGHSMGGLVALTAVAGGDPAWVDRVRAVVTLGSPRDGAPLERAAARTAEVATRSGHGHWLGGLIGSRSTGIRDLHDEVAHPPLPDHVREHVVLGSLTPAGWPPERARLGDGLVPVPRELGAGVVVLPGLNHLDLLNHPAVYRHLLGWLRSVAR